MRYVLERLQFLAVDGDFRIAKLATDDMEADIAELEGESLLFSIRELVPFKGGVHVIFDSVTEKLDAIADEVLDN